MLLKSVYIFWVLVNILAGIKHNFSVIGFTETWLKDSNSACYGIDGYQHFSAVRKRCRGGGVSLFVKNNLSATPRDDLDCMTKEMEALFIEIPKEDIGLRKNVIIGVIYHPPNTDVSIFTEKLATILQKIADERKLVYLLGDFNINLLESDNHLPTNEFLEQMYANSLFPYITKPTRIKNNSST